MKSIILFSLLQLVLITKMHAQQLKANTESQEEVVALISNYTKARETKDVNLLRSILTADVDQLVSSGEWRNGIEGSVEGMLRSSTNNPGKRTLVVDKVRFLNDSAAIADARYEIENTDGTARKMWSTFIVVYLEDGWKITAIRNMKPAGYN